MDTKAIRRFAALTAKKRKAQSAIDSANKELADLEHRLVAEMLEEGVKNAKVNVPGEGDFTVYVHSIPYTRLRDGVDRDAVALALRKAGKGFLVKPTYNKNQLDAWAREHVKEKGELPPSVGAVLEMDDRISLRANRA